MTFFWFFFSCLNAIQVVKKCCDYSMYCTLPSSAKQISFAFKCNFKTNEKCSLLEIGRKGKQVLRIHISEILFLHNVRSPLKLSPTFLFVHLHTDFPDSTATHMLTPDQLHFSTGQAPERELSSWTPPALPSCAGGGLYRRLSANAKAQLTIISLVVLCRLTHLHESKVVS